ncbi:MAG: M43 family zinc metalloprotease [Bacteroidia bacterium]
MKQWFVLSALSLCCLTACVGQKDTVKTAKKPSIPSSTQPSSPTRTLPSITQPTAPSAVNSNRVNTPKRLPHTGIKILPRARTRSLEPLKVRCGNDEIVNNYYNAPALVSRSMDEVEKFSQEFMSNDVLMIKAMEQTYYIPVVFHVLSSEGEKDVPIAQCQSALDKANEDFNALNADIGSVNPAFADITGKVNIKFVLAQKDPSGKPTTGVAYYEKRSGYGSVAYEDEIATLAWDNNRYMNVYLMEDLYGDGVTNNSGVSWYPDTDMNKRNVARIVFNYVYLGNIGSSIADEEFQSVFTHECGHWLNLRHTFAEGSCTDGDRVNDTPPTDVAAAGCGAKTSRCGNLINYENYMDYNAECYKMFTNEQTRRMVAALNHTARKNIWQNGNLAATGILETSNLTDREALIAYEYTKKKFSANADSIEIISEASGRVVATPPNPKSVNMATLPPGVYTMKMKKGVHIIKVRVGV